MEMEFAEPPARWLVRNVLAFGFLCGSILGGPTELILAFPARMSVSKPWDFLSVVQLGQDAQGNSSLRSRSEHMLLQQPSGSSRLPVVQAAFGPFTVKKELNPSLFPSAPFLHASILGGPEMVVTEIHPWVRVLFHWSGIREWRNESREQGMPCVTLHAFKETRELRATCHLQHPLGACVSSLTLPDSWFLPDGASVATGQKVELYYRATKLAMTSPTCVDAALHPSQSELFYVGYVKLQRKEPTATPDTRQADAGRLKRWGGEKEELAVDTNVVIRSPQGPLKLGRPITVSILLRGNFTADLVVIRAKLKKGLSVVSVSPPISPHTWSISVEKMMGSKHHTTSVICRRAQGAQLKDEHSSTSLMEVAQLSLHSENFTGIAVTRRISWQVEYPGRNPLGNMEGGALTQITLTHKEVLAIVPIAESLSLVNTAVLTGQAVSVPVTVLAVEQDGTVSDITHSVNCRSANEDVLKVSGNCASIYVNGEESAQGATAAVVEFYLESLRNTLTLSVWVPRIPLTIQLSDPHLSQIKPWKVHHLDRGCSLQYQRSSVQVLAQFAAILPEEEGGQLAFMLDADDWFVDVTEMVRDWLKTENPRIAKINKAGILIGQEPGVTSIQVVSSLWDTVIAQHQVTVTADKVTLGDLSVQLISGLVLSVKPSPGHNGVVTAAVSALQHLHMFGQEAVLRVWLQFSDDTVVPLEIFDTESYSLQLSSLAEGVISLEYSDERNREDEEAMPRAVARGEGGGPLIKAELNDGTMSCHKAKSSGRKKLGTLAAGSGWVRVNFDLSGQNDQRQEATVEDLEMDFLELHEEHYDEDKDDEVAEFLFGREEGAAIQDNAAASKASLEFENDSLLRLTEEDQLFGEQVDAEGQLNSKWEDDNLQRLGKLSDFEIGMYALLAVFCLGITVFFVNCIMFVLRYHRKGPFEVKEQPMGQGNLKSPHNWVWMGTDWEELGRQADLADLANQKKGKSPIKSEVIKEEEEDGGLHIVPSLLNTEKHLCGDAEEYSAVTASLLGLKATDESATEEETRADHVCEGVTHSHFPPFTENSKRQAGSILVASEEDIRWLCQDMGISQQAELENYMAKIKLSSEKLG
ncbi:transmembrane protein 132A isoform X2 [Erpetoichthys calabaricus]|uniref:transmembrane protein 132A isoform X2 n=1 Tax=Erpetoichthys calabaricus TaxID=27687 RepID=UPI002234A6A5|nr:transmembrane protein 132A isoform X2 [Erpetoichthys calabaricus]